MQRKYLIFPGSYRDQDYKRNFAIYYMNAAQLIFLYKVDPKECIIIPNRLTPEDCGYNGEDFIHLQPQPDRNYKLPI